MYLTANLKGHITISVMANAILELLPIKPSMTFPMKYSLMTLTFYRSCGLRRKHHAKIVYTCCDTCHPARGNLANEDSLLDNENIALASMKSRDERVTIKDAVPSSNTFAAAALRVDLHSLLRETTASSRILGSVYGFWIPCSGPESTQNGELLEGHSRTWGKKETQWSRSK